MGLRRATGLPVLLRRRTRARRHRPRTVHRFLCALHRRPRPQSPRQPATYRRAAPCPLRRRQDPRLDRMTIPRRPAPRAPRIAASPGLIPIRTPRRTSAHRGCRLFLRRHRQQHARRRPRSRPRQSRSVERSPCRGSGQTLLPLPQPPPAVRCHCPAPVRRLLPPKRPIPRSSPLPVTGPDSIAIAREKWVAIFRKDLFKQQARPLTVIPRRFPCAPAHSRPRQAPGRSTRRGRHRGFPS